MVNYTVEYIKIVFDELNKQMQKNDVFADVFLIGGMAGKYLLNEQFRETHDIDFLVKSVNDYSRLNDVMTDFNIEAVTVVELPPVEEIESSDVLEYSNLRVFIPTIEHYALTKIFSSRQKDKDDLTHLGIIENCDQIKLARLIHEYQPFFLNPEDPNLNLNTLRGYLKEKKFSFK